MEEVAVGAEEAAALVGQRAPGEMVAAGTEWAMPAVTAAGTEGVTLEVTAVATVVVLLPARVMGLRVVTQAATPSALGAGLRLLRPGARIAPVPQPDGSPLRRLDTPIRPVG